MQQNHPAYLQHTLYIKYSSSQIYYFTNLINEIVNERRTRSNINYQDVEYLCDRQEYLKRWYANKEYNSKMFSFKQFYFYHEDCPRIFMKGIEEVYTKWQDKKRDLVYKKLKLIHNEDYHSSATNSTDKSLNENDNPPIQHFLLDISQYNPYSKKYYLRVQMKKEQAEQNNKNKSIHQINTLQHQLSLMLNNIHDLSAISTLLDTPKQKPFHSRKSSHIKNTLQSSATNQSIKMNFKKTKSINKPQKISKEMWQKNNDEHLKTLHKDILVNHKISTNLMEPNSHPVKTQSIFSVSSFANLNKKITQIKLNPKRQLLKLNYESKQKQPRYQSEKPLNIIKSNSIGKLVNKQSLEKIKVRQISLKKKQKNDQFSDKKIIHIDNKLRSHKSQFSSLGKIKKTSFKIKNNRISEHHNKRVLELKNI